MSVVALIPVTVVFLVLQRRLTEGIASTGVKG
jgi:ABC-type glycerol-3-phosphate transport system permease component